MNSPFPWSVIPKRLELYSVFGYIPSPYALSLHLEAPKILVAYL